MSNVEFIVIFALGLFLLVFAANWIRTYSKAGQQHWMRGWIQKAEAQADDEKRRDAQVAMRMGPREYTPEQAAVIEDAVARRGTAVVPAEPRKGQTLSQPADWTDET